MDLLVGLALLLVVGTLLLGVVCVGLYFLACWAMERWYVRHPRLSVFDPARRPLDSGMPATVPAPGSDVPLPPLPADWSTSGAISGLQRMFAEASR